MAAASGKPPNFEALLAGHPELCDVEFSVLDPGRVDLGAEIVTAHKLVLSVASPVFKAMFYGGLKEKEVVEIPDSEPEAFKSMLRYVYTGSTNLPECQIMQVLYLARKYMIGPLEDYCFKMASDLNAQNVCYILHHSLLNGEAQLVERCTALIALNARQMLEQQVHLFTPEIWNHVFEQNLDNLKQIDLFNALKRWVKGHASTGDKREALGHLLFQIRYTEMTLEDLVKTVWRSGLLNDGEVGHVIKYVSQFPGIELPPFEPAPKPGKTVLMRTEHAIKEMDGDLQLNWDVEVEGATIDYVMCEFQNVRQRHQAGVVLKMPDGTEKPLEWFSDRTLYALKEPAVLSKGKGYVLKFLDDAFHCRYCSRRIRPSKMAAETGPAVPVPSGHIRGHFPKGGEWMYCQNFDCEARWKIGFRQIGFVQCVYTK